MTWTEQKIQLLKDMWGHGYSASEIAKILGGLTRNAVIGKAHRLKLSTRPATGKIDAGAVMRVATSSPAIAPITKVAQRRVMLRPLPVVPTPATVRSVTPPTKDGFRSLDSIKRTEGIAVTKAGDRHCRWPVGDPRSPDFRFCGCTAHEGMPYCVDHARVAYQNVGKKFRSTEGGSEASSDFRLPSPGRY